MRSKSIDLRKHVDSVMDRKKKSSKTSAALQSLESRNAPAAPTVQVTINDLPESEKMKISKLAEKVLELNGVIEQLGRQYESERMRHAEEIRSIHSTIDGQISIIEDRMKLKDAAIAKLQDKEKMITSMLALYQAKLKNMADICRLAGDNEEYNKKKVTQLQADVDHFQIIIQNQKKLIESFDNTKEQLEERMRSMETRHAKRVRTLEEMLSEETDRRVRTEKLNLQQSSEIVMLKADVQKLQYQAQQMRAMQSSDQDVLLPQIKIAQKQQHQKLKQDTSMIPLSNADQKSLQQVNETNPFKKYGPYDEYSLLFNNSRGDEEATPIVSSSLTPPQSHKHSRPGAKDYVECEEFSSIFPGMSPIPTPATTKVPFGGSVLPTNQDSSSQTDDVIKNPRGDDSPSRTLVSQAEQLLRHSYTVQLSMASPSSAADEVTSVAANNLPSATDKNMPILKSSEKEPISTGMVKPPGPASFNTLPVNSIHKISPFPSSSRNTTPVFLRESNDSVISSVNQDDDDTEDEEEEKEEEKDTESENESSDDEVHEEDEDEVEFDQALLSQHLSDMNLSCSQPVNQSLVSNISSVDASKTSKKKKAIVNSYDSRVPSSVDQNMLAFSSSSAKPKAFYPMRPLAYSMTASVGIADNLPTTSSNKKESTLTKKEKKIKTTTAQHLEPPAVTENIKPKTKKKSTKRKQPVAVSSSTPEFSFLSQESKDAVSLLHVNDKEIKLSSHHISSSHDHISYLPRPPPRSAQKVKPPITDTTHINTKTNKAKTHDIEQPTSAKKISKKHSSSVSHVKPTSQKESHSENYRKKIGKYDASLFDLVDALEEGAVGNDSGEE